MLAVLPLMHIPDGFLSLPVVIALWLVTLPVIALALRSTDRSDDDHDLPLMGVLAAAIFAGQMLNFPVAGGTSGHLLGAALAVILVGPWRAVLVMTSVVGLQALVFQDGGLLALGANLFNMAVIGVFSSYAVYWVVQRLSKGRKWGLIVGGFTAAWASIELAALAAGLQLAVSGTSPANIAIPAMGAVHALIGIGEGLITVGALGFLSAARPQLLQPEKHQFVTDWPAVVGGFLLAVSLAMVSPFASTHPDGLESVALAHGFSTSEKGSLFHLLPGYILPGIQNKEAASILAAVTGVMLLVGSALLIRRIRQPRT